MHASEIPDEANVRKNKKIKIHKSGKNNRNKKIEMDAFSISGAMQISHL